MRQSLTARLIAAAPSIVITLGLIIHAVIYHVAPASLSDALGDTWGGTWFALMIILCATNTVLIMCRPHDCILVAESCSRLLTTGVFAGYAIVVWIHGAGISGTLSLALAAWHAARIRGIRDERADLARRHLEQRLIARAGDDQ